MNRKDFIFNIGRSAVWAGMFVTVPSCKKFLTEKPENIIDPDTFFRSDFAANSAIIGLYELFHHDSLHGKIGLDRFYEYGADTIGPSRSFDQVDPFMSYIITEGNMDVISQGGGAPQTWEDLYKVIVNANLILKGINGNENISIDAQQSYRAEAIFFRSYAFYHLTNIWGDVPYFTEETDDTDIEKLGRTSKEEIRSNVISDLKEAKEYLPETRSVDENGRITKWVIETLLVKIYLWEKDWKNARDWAVDIIKNSPHQLLKNYSDVFDPTNEYNEELIWSIDFAKDINPNDWPDHFTPRLRDEPKNSADRDALGEELADRNEGFTGYGLAIPLPDIVEKFPLDDLRRGSNIIQNYLGFDLTFPYMKKFWSIDSLNSPRGNHGENKIIFRLSDVYLMAAEAENELNGPSDAYQYINRVRERAFQTGKPLNGMSKENLRKAIYDERKWELAGENHRRMDLIRWGILVDVVKETHYRLFNPANNITEKNILIPIPATEIQLNPNLLDSDPTNNGYR